ncbi:MAG: MBL fold metallo-hydrolase [Chloroflexota bacterium]|nr:MBL fold metallo-hydrolase [Chloroflexota bacterium]
MAEQVTRGVFTTGHRVVEGKNGIVVGTQRVLAIDSGTDTCEGQEMVDLVHGLGRAPSYLALTHGHGDHAYGAAAFRAASVDVLSHASCSRVIERHLSLRLERSGRARAAVAPEIAWPTITFPDQLRLDLGGKHVRLFHTPGHSADSVCVYVEEDRVLFGGDTVVTAIVPAFGGGNSQQMEASLRRLAALEIKVLVPGHGPVIRGAPAAREWLEWMADYLSSLRRHVSASLAAGRDAAAIVEALDYDSFLGRRHQGAARQLVREELAGRYAGRSLIEGVPANTG